MICVYVCVMCVYVCAYVCICVYVYMYVCACVTVCVSVRVCVIIHMCEHILPRSDSRDYLGAAMAQENEHTDSLPWCPTLPWKEQPHQH